MGLLEFSKLPVNTLVGADWKTFQEITKGQRIEKGYKTKYCLTKGVCRILSPLKGVQGQAVRQAAEGCGSKHGAGVHPRALAQRHDVRA